MKELRHFVTGGTTQLTNQAVDSRMLILTRKLKQLAKESLCTARNFPLMFGDRIPKDITLTIICYFSLFQFMILSLLPLSQLHTVIP